MMAACGAADGSRIPEPLELRGTYDLVATAPGTAPVAGVGSVAVGEDDVLVQLSHPPVTMEGTVTLERGVEIAGFTAHSDVRAPVAATGTAVVAAGVLRIRLVLSDQTEVSMERAVDADVSVAAGRFRLDFAGRSPGACAASLEIETPIERSGIGAVISRDDRSGAAARLEAASIDVAPSGRFALDATYVAPEGACPTGPIDGPPLLLLMEGSWPVGGVGTATTARYRLLSDIRFEIETADVTITRLE
jgi:hypothetical protein